MSAGCFPTWDQPAPLQSPGTLLTSSDFLLPAGVWSPDSKTLYTLPSQGLTAIDIATNSATSLGVTHPLGRIAMTPEGSHVIYSGDIAGPTGWSIYRRSLLLKGPGDLITAAASPDFVLSPDGSTVAFHPSGVADSLTSIQLRTIVSGVQSAVIGNVARPVAFSADGAQLAFLPRSTLPDFGSRGPLLVWNSTTGVVEQQTVVPSGSGILDVKWREGFRVLMRHPPGSYGNLVDRSSAGTDSIPLIEERGPLAVSWLPDLAAVVTITVGKTFYEGEAQRSQYLIQYRTATSVRTLGSINVYSTPPLGISVSPNRRWVAYSAGSGVYLLPLHPE